MHAFGNTSAYAEKRGLLRIAGEQSWKYLRVCGEESQINSAAAFDMEIPPRMRRRGAPTVRGRAGPGNTSAYAEKSESLRGEQGPKGKYLRVCGEETAKVAGV